MSHRALALLVALGGAGCTRMAIEGDVVDVTGAPIAGARVTTIGSPCQADSDEKGHFELVCPPGSYTLSVGQAGYLSKELDVEATEKKRYNVDRVLLIKIPDSKGLFLLQDGAYVPLARALITRAEGKRGGDRTRSYCLDRARSEAVELPAGAATFFDNEHEGWTPFRIDPSDDDGCVYRMHSGAFGKWAVDWSENPPYEERAVGKEQSLVRVQLEPGDYFFADWKGFFVPIEGELTTYGGVWVRVTP